jgi:glutaredoxin-like protein
MATAQQDLIPSQEKPRLKREFRKHLKADVRLRLYTQRPSPIAIPGRDCRYCPQVQQLMEELASLSPKLDLETVEYHIEREKAQQDEVSRIPAVVIGADSGKWVRFYGLPLGYELPILVESIKALSRGNTRLSVNSRKQLRRVDKPVHLQVFVTPGSETSAGMALLALSMAVESANVHTDVIEVEEFPDLARRYGVRQVPLTVINEFTSVSGMVSEAELLEKVLLVGLDSHNDA